MHELLLQVIFYAFAALTLFCGVMVVTQNNPVRCVLFLVLAFIASSVLWILAQAEFLALILVLVYVGAVMTLFLFVVMMLNIDTESMKTHFRLYFPAALILVALLVGLLLIVIPTAEFTQSVEVATKVNQNLTSGFINMHDTHKHLSNTEELGMVLYTNYVLAFELAAVILLVAIIAAITLTHRRPINSKTQNIVKQLMTKRDERVTLVRMKSEKE